mmetsp:Transcript_70781/g.178460  ORF Transcript_70781/g.178460 Transcript_70781/m.178460 type:complete len:101 (-) Transcript_70781:38-340(-)
MAARSLLAGKRLDALPPMAQQLHRRQGMMRRDDLQVLRGRLSSSRVPYAVLVRGSMQHALSSCSEVEHRPRNSWNALVLARHAIASSSSGSFIKVEPQFC